MPRPKEKESNKNIIYFKPKRKKYMVYYYQLYHIYEKMIFYQFLFYYSCSVR